MIQCISNVPVDQVIVCPIVLDIYQQKNVLIFTKIIILINIYIPTHMDQIMDAFKRLCREKGIDINELAQKAIEDVDDSDSDYEGETDIETEEESGEEETIEIIRDKQGFYRLK